MFVVLAVQGIVLRISDKGGLTCVLLPARLSVSSKTD